MEPRRGNRLVDSLIAETGSSQLLSRHHTVLPTRERAHRQPNLSSSVPSRSDARIRNKRMKISPLGLGKVPKLGLFAKLVNAKAECSRACASADRPAWSAAPHILGVPLDLGGVP